ncbi:MAG: O-antigen ligase family protein [Verrucomicrobia bacterium]|jgi:hypothetical protein|nr:O-antigen ligase family protein [Verrucomicrobiota bacterium]
MVSTFAASRNRLILGVCLPLAVLLGYLLAEPLESSSLAVVVMVLSVLVVPLLMRWHHPLLIVSWNAAITPFFFPGRSAIWVLMAFVSLFFGILGRSVSSANRFLQEPRLTRSLLGLLGVVGITACMTGGIGMASLGAESSYGGSGYFYLLAATVGYFALTSRPIPRPRAQLYVALFFLSGLTAIISHLAFVAGPRFWFLYDLFPVELAMDQALAQGAAGPSVVRINGFVQAAPALYCFVLARYGIRGLFDLTRPWRMGLVLVAVFASLFGGFRSTLVLLGLMFVILFLIEGLWRTRFLWIVLFSGVVVAGAFLPFVDKMPLSVQRTVSFLPLDVDPWVKLGAQDSTTWRLEMWRTLLPDVPKYLFKGKGYAINAKELLLITDAITRGDLKATESLAFSGQYHNGPLSVVIPFGIYGLAAFIWFLGAGVRVLYRNYRQGDLELRRVNAFLLAVFIARIVNFVFIFGAFSSDLYYFTGLLGLGVALNGGAGQRDERNRMASDGFEPERE